MQHQDGVPASGGTTVISEIGDAPEKTDEKRSRCKACKAFVADDGICTNPQCSTRSGIPFRISAQINLATSSDARDQRIGLQNLTGPSAREYLMGLSVDRLIEISERLGRVDIAAQHQSRLYKARITILRALAVRRAQDLLDADPVAIDVETSGVGSSAEVVEIAVVDANGETLLDTQVRPEDGIPEEFAEYHGITDGDVADAPVWAEVQEQFQEAVAGRSVVAYNGQFDQRMIRQSAERAGLEEPKYFLEGDVMALYGLGVSDNERDKLIEAAQKAGVARDAHSAADDAKMTMDVLRYVAGAPYESECGVVRRWTGQAWRSLTGYSHDQHTTAADVVRHGLGDDSDVPDKLLAEMEDMPASSVAWVAGRREDAARYGEPSPISVSANALIVGNDGDGRYLVLDPSPWNRQAEYEAAIENLAELKAAVLEASTDDGVKRTPAVRSALDAAMLDYHHGASPLHSLREALLNAPYDSDRYRMTPELREAIEALRE
jgi:DNA polymerase-3 subunit epsilon